MPRPFGRPVRRASSAMMTTGGIRGLAISIDASELGAAVHQLAQFKNAFQRRMLRTALTKSTRPVRKRMVQLTREYSRGSRRKEGIGATARSIILKVRTSQANPANAYALIGVRSGYTERVSLVDPNRRSGVRNVTAGRRRKVRGQSRMQYRTLKSIGSIARKARLNPSRVNVGRHKRLGSSVKRKPSKYFHLIDSGAKHINRIGHFLAQSHQAFNAATFYAQLRAEVNAVWGTQKGQKGLRKVA